ncbi:MAG: prepilin-type N-terminal cleavage/methylation domain-containing protein [Planctomycetota bacterium]|jgi:prepilin-type N-terminal cleavage/methylation domain-containing protein
MKKSRGFTLVEILIVVVLLGVLAAVVIPLIAHGALSARESALAADLQMLRRYVLMYRSQHLEVAPGYPNGDKTQAPSAVAFFDQMTMSSNSKGQTAPVGTPGFNRGPYLMKMPVNPLNNKDTLEVLADGAAFPANGDNSHGWVYKAATAEVRADCSAANSGGKLYYDY